MVSPIARLLLAASLVLMACPRGATPEDGGMMMKPPVKETPDSGSEVPPWMRYEDAGFVFQDKYAAEPCPPESWSDVTYKGSEPAIGWGICVALREMTGTALLNERAVKGNAEIKFEAANFESQIIRPVEPSGRYNVKVMRGRYDILKYRPEGIWPNHRGFLELSYADMTKNQERDLKVNSYRIRGGAFFGGLPFASVQFPPDVYFRAAGIPPNQHAGSTSVGGTYELALMEGTMALLLNTPPTALQGTELVDYPLTWSFPLHQDSNYDVNIAASELEGSITFDGLPLSDRKPGDDYELVYIPSGEMAVAAVTHHEGGVAGFHSMLPRGKYAVNLSFDSIPDRHFPAQIYNKQVAQQVDLTQNGTLQKNFVTVPIEGGITIDGESPTVNPGYNWVLYMYAYAGSVEPWFFAYYRVPLDSGSFTLRALPGTYFVAIQLGDELAPDLADGFARVSRQKEIYSHTSLPIEIETSVLSGKLLIDGVPPPAGKEAGTIVLRQSDQSFSRRIFAAPDGEFRVRVPKGAYEVFFSINRETFPQYASGRQRMVSRVELFEDQVANLHYDTKPVVGPIRLGGQMIADNLGGDDVQLIMHRKEDSATFVWGFPGGSSEFYMRLPVGAYQMEFSILQDAIADTAWGVAPLGYFLPVR